MKPEDAWIHRGNRARLRRCLQRAEAGESLCLGVLGGSITQGACAEPEENCYARRLLSRWRERFPNTEPRLVNAGIGGTDSRFGAARAEADLLAHRPDLVVLEFSVNDENSEAFYESYEGLVRRVYGDACRPAVILLMNCRYDDLSGAEEMHLRVGRHYDLPCLSLRAVLAPALRAGLVRAGELSPDGLHPNNRGHALLASLLTALLERVQAEPGREAEPPMPAPLTANAWEHSRRLRNPELSAHTEGFVPDLRPQASIRELFRRGYTARQVGDRIRLRVSGTEIAVQYRKSVRRPAPVALAILDGQEERAVRLDANFEENWGDCLYLQTLQRHGPGGEHELEIRIAEASENDAVPFYLVSVIASEGENAT